VVEPKIHPALTFWTEWSHIGGMTAGRPLQFNPEASLEQAMETFWAQGYEATSLQDLLDATGLSKSSLYQQFGGKSALFDRCLQHYCLTRAAAMRERLDAAESGLAFIADSFYGIADGASGKAGQWGCLLMNTANELGQRDPLTADQIAAGKEGFAKVFRAAIERAQREGDIPPERDSRALADFLVSNMSGLRTLLKTGMKRKQARAIVDQILAALG
jgi:TetR/AcrR family transcriptional repressor of nem operon